MWSASEGAGGQGQPGTALGSRVSQLPLMETTPRRLTRFAQPNRFLLGPFLAALPPSWLPLVQGFSLWPPPTHGVRKARLGPGNTYFNPPFRGC